jgi:ABC-type multidrug transport system fused ATPase/permease subunit
MKRLLARFRESTFGRATQVLSPKDQKKVLAVLVLQVCIGVLDLLGVIAVGLLGALSVTGLQSSAPGNQVSSVLNFLHLTNISFENQALFLGVSAVVLLVGRTVISIFFTRRILFFLSNRGAQISANLVSRLLSQSLTKIQSRTSQETLFAVTRGVEYVTLQILAPAIVLVSDVALLFIMAVGLFAVDPLTAIGTFFVFLTIGYALYRFLHVRAGALGARSSELNIVSNEKIVEVFSSYRESVVRNRRDFYAREIGKYRFALASTSAEMNFLPYISKYVIETSVILGALLIGATQFLLQDAAYAVATLAIFLVAGTRIAPAVLRVQQGFVLIRVSMGQAKPTLDLIESLGTAPLTVNIDDKVDVIHKEFLAEISVENVGLTYPGKATPAVINVSLNIPSGKSVAFVGPSGAGKTTIIDVLLGVLLPDVGSVRISGLPPQLTVAKWPGAVSYVPQDVVIAAGTIRENVALGYPISEATDELVTSALKVAQLESFIASLPDGIDTQVGERGTKISGGQRQRLGIARAMFTRPHLLVLDEATSSLDGETEAGISEAIQALRGATTVVMIAHRLSTVRDADIVVYMDKGRVLAVGTFNEVRDTVPDFDRQAKLMGL